MPGGWCKPDLCECIEGQGEETSQPKLTTHNTRVLGASKMWNTAFFARSLFEGIIHLLEKWVLGVIGRSLHVRNNIDTFFHLESSLNA